MPAWSPDFAVTKFQTWQRDVGEHAAIYLASLQRPRKENGWGFPICHGTHIKRFCDRQRNRVEEVRFPLLYTLWVTHTKLKGVLELARLGVQFFWGEVRG